MSVVGLLEGLRICLLMTTQPLARFLVLACIEYGWLLVNFEGIFGCGNSWCLYVFWRHFFTAKSMETPGSVKHPSRRSKRETAMLNSGSKISCWTYTLLLFFAKLLNKNNENLLWRYYCTKTQLQQHHHHHHHNNNNKNNNNTWM